VEIGVFDIRYNQGKLRQFLRCFYRIGICSDGIDRFVPQESEGETRAADVICDGTFVVLFAWNEISLYLREKDPETE